MSQKEGSEINNKYMKKRQREMSKAGQEEQEIVSRDLNASFSDNSETEREKDFARGATAFEDNNPKTYKKRSDVPSRRPLK
jgi:hypothetical protein